MLTVVVAGVPALTRASGMLPKLSRTRSPSSSSSSWAAVKTNVCSVSVGLNVTLAGTPV